MRKAIEIGQSLNLFSVLANNADWNNLDSDIIQKIINDPKGSGQQFTAFLRNGGRVIVSGPQILPFSQERFNAEKFIGNGWSIVDGESDTRLATLNEIDLNKVQFVTMLKDGENVIKGEEKLARLKKAGHIRLDARVFRALWENKHLIPESWKEKINGNTRYIFFDGTVLRDSNGNRYVLFLYWHDGKWYWNIFWLDNDWYANCPSAVLAS